MNFLKKKKKNEELRTPSGHRGKPKHHGQRGTFKMEAIENTTHPLKRNEIMLSAATWMDLQIIILSEVSQTEKDKYHMISFICRI